MRSKYLEDSTMQKLRHAMTGEEWLALQISLETGLRVGDVCALHWSDVHGREITFRAQKTGKYGRATVSEETYAQLKRRRRGRASEWVFPSPTKVGMHLTRQAVWARVKRAADAAGVDASGISPHSMRKNFAVGVYRARGLEAAKEALQHDRAEVTELYAFADFLSEGHADEPLYRRDLPRIADAVAEILAEKIARRA